MENFTNAYIEALSKIMSKAFVSREDFESLVQSVVAVRDLVTLIAVLGIIVIAILVWRLVKLNKSLSSTQKVLEAKIDSYKTKSSVDLMDLRKEHEKLKDRLSRYERSNDIRNHRAK